MKKQTLLIVGGGGYIGQICAEYLYSIGYTIIVFDNLESGTPPANFNFILGDIRNPSDLESVFQQHSIDCVLHLAAKTQVPQSVNQPIRYYHTNTLGTINLVQVMLKYNVHQLIFSSTAAVYGPCQTPLVEESARNPINPYGHSKKMAEDFLLSLEKNSPLRLLIFRYFNVAGALLEPLLGELRHVETHLIPIIIKSVLQNQPLYIYGTNYQTLDGTCIRDYVHVLDIAKAHAIGISHLQQQKCGIYNLGSGRGYSVLEVLQQAEHTFQKKIDYRKTERRAGDPPILVTDCQKAQKELMWSPKHSSIQEIMNSAVAFAQRNA